MMTMFLTLGDIAGLLAVDREKWKTNKPPLEDMSRGIMEGVLTCI